MKFKAYYYEDKNYCIITEEQQAKPIFENIKSDRNSIIIDIKQKNVENIYDFFRNNTLNILLLTFNNDIEIDYTEIENKEIFKDAAFVQLIELINNLVEETNNTIKECVGNVDDENSGNDLEKAQ
jgi:hypothetical protein